MPTNPAVLAKQAALCAKFNIAGPEVLQLAHLTFGNGLPGEHGSRNQSSSQHAHRCKVPTRTAEDRAPFLHAARHAYNCVLGWGRMRGASATAAVGFLIGC
jgi:hypothetical protein